MKGIFKALKGKDIHQYTIHDITFDENSPKISVDFEIFEEEFENDKFKKNYFERSEDGVPVIHRMEFEDWYAVDYLLDGQKDDSAYEAFCDAVYDYTYRNYNNNLFGTISQDDIENLKFKNIIQFLQADDNEKIQKYESTVTLYSFTSLWLNILRELNYRLNYDDLNKLILPKINEMMARYLKENPKFIEKIELINKKLNSLLSNEKPTTGINQQPTK